MSTDNDSFLKPRYLSETSLHSVQETDTRIDLITFLAVIQKLQIGIIPITWQVARQPIGVGATGKINQASINLHTSFAFKCVSDRQKDSNSEATIIQALINEIIILGQTSIRKHLNIVELQGVCWDVESNDKVWPVLVFEKTRFGDLHDFLTLPVGREIGFAQRLKLCVDIGTAILDMHFNRRFL
jgi:hypothetical protein